MMMLEAKFWSHGLRAVRVLPLAFWLAFFANALPARAELQFFPATDSDDAYAKNPSSYDRVALPPGSAKDVVYVEHRVILSIPLGDIRSVTIERKPFAQSMEDAIRQMQGMPPQSGSQTQAGRAAFEATFTFTSKAAQRISDVASAHEKGLLDIRLNTGRLGVARIVGSFKGTEFQLYLSEMDRSAVERLFRPIKNKVVWKDQK